MSHVWAGTIFLRKKEAYINLYFSRLFIRFSKTVLVVQWLLNQLESPINLYYWDFAIWSGFITQIQIVGFLNSPVIHIYYFSIFKSNPSILKILQSTLKIVSISQFVCIFIYIVVSLRQAGKYILHTLNTPCMIFAV